MVENENGKKRGSVTSRFSPEFLIGIVTLFIIGFGALQWHSQLNDVKNKIDNLDVRLDSRLSEERKYFTGGINRLSDKIDRLSDKIGRLETNLALSNERAKNFSQYTADKLEDSSSSVTEKTVVEPQSR